MNLNAFREKVNIRLFRSKETALDVLNYITILVSLTAMTSMVIFHGFPTTEESTSWHFAIIKSSFCFYILGYIIRFVYDFSPSAFLKKSWVEGSLLAFMALDLVLEFSFGTSPVQWIGNLMGLPNLESFYSLFIQIFFLIIIFVELGKVQARISNLGLSPPTLLILSFIALIFLGCGLLMLPEMSQSGQSMAFMDAMFTSISASCVTGLVIVDTGTFFSLKGQIIIMLLIQLGGINIITFATLFTILSGQNLGIKHQSLIQDNFSAESLISGKGLLRQIFMFSVIIELVGTLFIFLLWHPNIEFAGVQQKWFYSIFHSISAFNNAGFSLFSESLAAQYVNQSFLLHLIIAGLIVLGGLGFPVLRDLFTASAIRNRVKYPWKSYRLHTKVTLLSFLVLTLMGFIVFLTVEWNGSMKGMQFAEKAVTSFFQSVTTRTAGFNTVDIGSISTPVLLIFMFLMFIGAAPGSTGGGIKTSAFALIGLAAYSTIRGKKNLELFHFNINYELLNKAYSILLFAFSLIFFGTFALTLLEPKIDILDLVFEQVSAVSTVGLSTGITTDLGTGGRIIIMLSMFIGRIGTLSIAFALSRKVKTVDYKYPNAHLHVA